MRKFHEELSSIDFRICSVCFENFPGSKMASKSIICQRCCRDKKNPKLYSSYNNMDPGQVPIELQVSHTWIRFFEDLVYVQSVTIDMNTISLIPQVLDKL